MAYVIVQPCVGVKDGACATACPVDCIDGRPEDSMLYIDPERCIDCDVCVTVCPVSAIYPAHKVPQQWSEYIAINERYFAVAGADS